MFGGEGLDVGGWGNPILADLGVIYVIAKWLANVEIMQGWRGPIADLKLLFGPSSSPVFSETSLQAGITAITVLRSPQELRLFQGMLVEELLFH